MRSTKLLAVLAVIAGVAGCASNTAAPPATTSSQPATQSEPSSLIDALAHIKATDSTRSYVQYVDNRALHELISDMRIQDGNVRRLGLGELGPGEGVIGKTVGVEASQMRTRIVAGAWPDEAGLWYGTYDVSKVNAWFKTNGGTPDASGDATRWLVGNDFQQSVKEPFRTLVPRGAFNVVRTTPNSFAWSAAGIRLAEITDPGNDTLATDETIAPLTQCLGNVKAAMIQQLDHVYYAAGLRATSEDDVTEVACILPQSADQAKAMLDKTKDHLPSGGHVPKDTIVALTGPSDSIVQFTWHYPHPYPVGQFISALYTGDFERMLHS
jgi:hypothetical protein